MNIYMGGWAALVVSQVWAADGDFLLATMWLVWAILQFIVAMKQDA